MSDQIQLIKVQCRTCRQIYTAIIEIQPTIINNVLYNVMLFTPEIINSICVRCQNMNYQIVFYSIYSVYPNCINILLISFNLHPHIRA